MSEQAVEEIAHRILKRLGDAWNAADGRGFAEPFAADADFVNIRGDYHRGREAIAQGHQSIFDTIYKGSRVAYTTLQARALTDDVILVHVRGELAVPTGPLAGEYRSVAMLVLVHLDQGPDWEIAAFHNTLVAPPR